MIQEAPNWNRGLVSATRAAQSTHTHTENMLAVELDMQAITQNKQQKQRVKIKNDHEPNLIGEQVSI